MSPPWGGVASGRSPARRPAGGATGFLPRSPISVWQANADAHANRSWAGPARCLRAGCGNPVQSAGRARNAGSWQIDLLGLVVMAGWTHRLLGVGLCQHHFAVLGRGVAHLAASRLKRRMLEPGHQFGCGRLVRIVALQAVGRGEGLVLVRLLKVRILRIVAIQAQTRAAALVRWNLFSIVGFGPGLVGVWQVSQAHVESGMTACPSPAQFQSRLVAAQAEVFLFAARCRLEQLILVVAGSADRGR